MEELHALTAQVEKYNRINSTDDFNKAVTNPLGRTIWDRRLLQVPSTGYTHAAS